MTAKVYIINNKIRILTNVLSVETKNTEKVLSISYNNKFDLHAVYVAPLDLVMKVELVP